MISLFSRVFSSDYQTISFEVDQVVIFLFICYRNASQNGDPYYNGYLFQSRNQTRQPGNLTGNPLYDDLPLPHYPHYPAMVNPYPIYQNPLPSASMFEPDRDSDNPSPSETSNDRNKRSSWSLTEERCLIAAYKEYYGRLKSTKSSQGKKNIWEDILKQFQSMCLSNGVESEKSLAQLKEKWRALLDKYKNVCDHNNRTGRERKTFTHYEDIDEFMASSDKVNPRFVKETNYNSEDTDDILSTGNQDCGKKPEKRPATTAESESVDAGKTGKTGQKEEKGPKKKKKRLSGDDMELGILDMMKAQQEAIKKSEENDERVLEALLKSQSEAQRQHQEFVVSVLGKLGDIFASKK